MPRVAIQGEMDSDESHLVKVDPGGTFEQFIEQAESRLGFRPAAVYLNGTRVMSVEDLEENEVAEAVALYRRVLSFGRAAAK